jgi:hypothetical protein
MLKQFAQKKGLQYTPGDQGQLAAELSQKLAIEGRGLARSFMQIKDIVTDGQISLFRCIESLDLNPYIERQTQHIKTIYVFHLMSQKRSTYFLGLIRKGTIQIYIRKIRKSNKIITLESSKLQLKVISPGIV